MDKRKKRKQHARVILIAMVTRQEGDDGRFRSCGGAYLLNPRRFHGRLGTEVF
jgi:hypothetical protein